MSHAVMVPTSDTKRGRWVRYRQHCLYPGPRLFDAMDELAYRQAYNRLIMGYRHNDELKRRIRWHMRFAAFDRTALRLAKRIP